MFHIPHIRIILGLSILVTVSLIYELSIFHYDDEQYVYLPPDYVYWSTKQVDYGNKIQENLSPKETDVMKVNKLLSLVDNVTEFHDYLQTLMPSQIENVIKQMGVSNLTRDAQKQFLECAGIALLKQAKGQQSNSPIPITPIHKRCKQMSFQDSGPTVALLSFPGSGSTLVRQLLESATGIYTGTVNCDESCIKAGMIGEGISTNNVLAVKMHFGPHFVRKFIHSDKAIYVVRSPFAAILSKSNREVAASKKEVAINHGMCVFVVSLRNDLHTV